MYAGQGQSMTMATFEFQVVNMPKGMVHHLPAEIGNLYVYKEAGILTIEEKDAFTLQCNLLFDVCTLQFSGTYEIFSEKSLLFKQ